MEPRPRQFWPALLPRGKVCGFLGGPWTVVALIPGTWRNAHLHWAFTSGQGDSTGTYTKRPSHSTRREGVTAIVRRLYVSHLSREVESSDTVYNHHSSGIDTSQGFSYVVTYSYRKAQDGTQSNVNGMSGYTKHDDHATPPWGGDMVEHERNGDRKPVFG
jgi:hypothetical protein